MPHAAQSCPRSSAAGGAGLALLLGDKLKPEQRCTVGWTLLAIGVLTTIPVMVDVIGKLHEPSDTTDG